MELPKPMKPPVADRTPSAPRRRRARLEHRNLPLLMLVAREGVTSFFRSVFREFGLTEQQWRILRVLNEKGELMIGQIAESTYVLGPSLSGILQRMIEADLVVKRVDPQDTRRFYVSATRRGINIFDQMVPRIEEEYTRLEQIVGASRISELYALLDLVIEEIERASNLRPPHADTKYQQRVCAVSDDTDLPGSV